MTWIPSCGLQT